MPLNTPEAAQVSASNTLMPLPSKEPLVNENMR